MPVGLAKVVNDSEQILPNRQLGEVPREALDKLGALLPIIQRAFDFFEAFFAHVRVAQGVLVFKKPCFDG
jgi:hypothetical protein